MTVRAHSRLARSLSRKGLGQIEECPACGTRVRPNLRRVPHPETAECKTIVAAKALADRGYVRIPNEKQRVLFAAAAVPIEAAKTGYHLEPRVVATGATASAAPKGKVVHEAVLHDEIWAPAAAVMVMRALMGIRIPDHFKARALRVLWQRPDVPDAVATIRALGGRVVGFLHQLVTSAEEEERDAPAAMGDPEA